MMGLAFVLMWLLGLFFQIAGIFIWFLLGFGAAAIILGFLAGEDF